MIGTKLGMVTPGERFWWEQEMVTFFMQIADIHHLHARLAMF